MSVAEKAMVWPVYCVFSNTNGQQLNVCLVLLVIGRQRWVTLQGGWWETKQINFGLKWKTSLSQEILTQPGHGERSKRGRERVPFPLALMKYKQFASIKEKHICVATAFWQSRELPCKLLHRTPFACDSRVCETFQLIGRLRNEK